MLFVNVGATRFTIEYERRITKLNVTSNTVLATFAFDDSSGDDDVNLGELPRAWWQPAWQADHPACLVNLPAPPPLCCADLPRP